MLALAAPIRHLAVGTRLIAALAAIPSPLPMLAGGPAWHSSPSESYPQPRRSTMGAPRACSQSVPHSHTPSSPRRLGLMLSKTLTKTLTGTLGGCCKNEGRVYTIVACVND